jgi:hypothetical protein
MNDRDELMNRDGQNVFERRVKEVAHRMLESKEHRDKIINHHYNISKEIGMPKNTEDKKWYCKYGEMTEKFFVDLYGRKTPMGFAIQINPDKSKDMYAKDYSSTKYPYVYFDLKGQCVPFFTSQYKYGINPQMEKTLNVYDIKEYRKLELEKHIRIYLLIWLLVWNKEEVSMYNEKFKTKVYLMEGLWAVRPQQILSLPENRRPIHISKARSKIDNEEEKREKGHYNKIESYVIDCKDLPQCKVFCKKWDI